MNITHEYLPYVLYLAAGMSAGIVNTLAGGASVFTLSVMIFFDTPLSVANGTNRLGILAQSLTGALDFKKSGLFRIGESLPFVIPSLIGAAAGALIAVDLNREILEKAIGIVMIFILFTILYKPKSKTTTVLNQKKPINRYLNFIVFLGIGFYGGFVQVGAGLIIIVALAKVAKVSLIRSNAIKMVIILSYTIPAFIIFVINEQVNWLLGIWLATGQLIGAKIASRLASDHPEANKIIKFLLIVMIVLSIIKMFAPLNDII